MAKIKELKAREILNSKGSPALEVDLFVGKDFFSASVPSGISSGAHEALELRDGGARYQGRGVKKAAAGVEKIIAPKIIGMDPCCQKEIDELMLGLDGTENKEKLGANAILAVSLAVSRAAAASKGLLLWQYLHKSFFSKKKPVMPQPMILILEGGRHGNWATDIQEYMVVPQRKFFKTFSAQIEAGTKVFLQMEKILKKKGYNIGVGAEGAFCPQEIKSNEEAFELLLEAIKAAGYSPGKEFVLAIDAAASEFFAQKNYLLRSQKNKKLSAKKWGEKICAWLKDYPLWSLEDIFDQDDWENWVEFVSLWGKQKQIVGDDLLTTSVQRIKKAIALKAANSVLIKPNQIGTLSETFEAIKVSDSSGWSFIISHRAGETNDDFIADLAVASGAGQCKFGAPQRGERIAKYNRLLRIEEELFRK